MNIYRITQDEHRGYDTYDSAIVVAESENEAKKITPDGNSFRANFSSVWATKPENVTVELVGTTDLFPTGTVLCASFNAG
jgi:hypothetical protein